MKKQISIITAVTLAIVFAVAGLYVSGHGIELPQVKIDWVFLHLGGAELILLATGFGVFVLTLRLFLRLDLPKSRR